MKGLAVFGLIVVGPIAWAVTLAADPEPRRTPPSVGVVSAEVEATDRCPEDAVLWHDECVPADNFEPGSLHRTAAEGMLGFCPVGMATIEDAYGEVVGGCRGEVTFPDGDEVVEWMPPVPEVPVEQELPPEVLVPVDPAPAAPASPVEPPPNPRPPIQ